MPGAPTSLTATASGSTTINLSWSTPDTTGGSAITGYKIEVSSDSASSWTDLVADTNSTTYAHTGLAAGTTRHYRVSAINTNGTGLPSSTADATTGTPPNNPPTVTNAIPDQTATADTAFSYAFPTNTFSDVDTGDTLSYAATKADGMELPTWLAFTDSTRTFAGTPATADVGTVAVKVTASDGNGGSVSDTFDITVAATVPGAPTSLTATASGSTTIDLSWTAPADNGGSAVTGYKIEVSPNGTSNWTNLVADTTTTAYAHTGLAAGTTRHYRVSAINTNGTGLPSNVDDATTGTTVPGAPTSLTATASGSTTINLSWSTPDTTGGSAITGYKIEVSSDSASSWTDLVADTNSTTYAHTGLAAGTTRHYRVSAINTNGTGLPSSTADATTGTPPNNPPMVANAIPDQSATADTAFSYAFPDTTFSDADSDTLSYAATKADGMALPTWLAFTDSTRTFAGTPATADVGTVAVKVTASDGNGGSVSDTFDITVAATVPGAPTSLSATASGATTIDLSWTAPADNGGSAVTGYKIEVSPNGTSNWTNLVADTNSTTYAHTGLAAGTTRHYRVSAINTNGTGLPSNVDDATTGTTVPGAPTSLTATASGSTTINLSWSTPDTTGGSAITGYKIEVSSDSASSWTDLVADTNSTTYAHTGLAAGTTRHYRVSAINNNGTGLPSSTADATTGTTVPGAPASLTATASGTTTINLSWTAPDTTGGSAITGYKIEVSSDSASSWTDLVADTNSTTYAHTGLAAGTTRHYRVSAINSVGTGLPSNVDSATTNTPGDTKPPVLARATVDSTTLELIYDETLDGASVPAAGAFAVTAAGNAVTASGGSVGGSAVTLTLANAVQANQTVTLDYTPGTNPIQDGAGNDAAALSGQSVTNNTGGGPRVSIGPWLLSVSEDVGDAVLTVSLDRPAASALSVAWHTQDETANAPDDYTASEGPVTFAAGESQKTISVPIVDDAVQEDPVNDVYELFFVMLSPGEGYTLADNPLADSSAAIVEIVDNDGVSSGDAANDALDLVDGVTPEVAAAVLLGEQRLSEAQLAALDRLGNRNGRYDLGDLLSWIARCRRGEARCGSSSTDSGPGSAAMLGAATAGSRSTPKRPGRRDSGRRGRSSTGGIRRRARMAGHALAILLAATMTWSCTEGGLVGPVAAPPDPGFLTVEWSGPATNRDAGVLLEFEGPTIDAVRAPGLELYESSAPGPHRIVVAGVLRPGPLVQFRVPDRNQFALYRVRVLQVTGEDDGLRDVGEYQAVITLHR